MQTGKQPAFTSGSLFRYAPFWKYGMAISLLLHVCFLVVLGSWTISKPVDVAESDFNTRWKEPQKRNSAELIITPTPTVKNEKEQIQPSQSRLQVFSETTSFTQLPKLNPQPDAPIDLSRSLTEEFTKDLAQPVDSSSGQPGGQGQGEGASVPFFGINAEGKKVVYVVDSSRSMNHSHSKKFKTRFDRIKYELNQSINRLDQESEFFIIFFNHDTIPMPARTLQVATSEVRRFYLHWVSGIHADGETDPRQALYLALSLKPDVIYFLTDGSIERVKIENDLRKIKQDQTAIHTIAFGNRNAEPLLRKIASKNRGRFYFVP